MAYSTVSAGKDAPNDINVIIEIPMNSDPVKYEVDKDTDAVFVDRFISTPMFYPCNYGYVPNTLGGDGDPADVLVVAPYPVAVGSVIRCRPVGVLDMEDDGGDDKKVMAVPVSKLTSLYDHVQDINDLPQELLNSIQHFFEHYKDLEKGKWVKIKGWGNVEAAKAELQASIDRA